MFVIFDKESGRLPIKVWLENQEALEPGCLTQAENLSRLPFAFRHIALMPDTHQGYGMPIGGVLATKGAVVPNAVGVDIGCGMRFVETCIPADVLNVSAPGGPLKNYITGQIMRAIPTGFAHHQEPRAVACLARGLREVAELMPELDAARYQLGTLGGGNHFIELQTTPEGKLCVMIHSGSRNLGYKITNHFDKVARTLNGRWRSSVPQEWELAFLPQDSPEREAYLDWMYLALDFAAENRARMMTLVCDELFDAVRKYAGIESMGIAREIDVHHNYAAIENHFGENVWVHRKGAIRARVGDIGIVPGAMGADSFLVQGLGNPESFMSCSHGAGRRMGRKEAMRQYAAADVIRDLDAKGIVLGKAKRGDTAEECLQAYKDLDEVMANEQDLVKPIMRLRNAGVVVKG